ncbi:MAG: 4-(cytidine 5'-diphospho)-2-C-methyl-D-erythritol kinase [Desulfitobacteriaceae bacterium]|nr:4-(cytidine 5'-diphospho)-2-C-methyl-D-erythritol kinase [Desulfitobacteriaceae bacterium]MDD4346248.1 4-(cytidine 5'-diphospho)-2-C-methyl-D-erythritol kinase [Desulfitobacteriaceae bacterium]MDD4400282.1 4-(cytidine 5'-diphospho)-2-C-methyl-D-erythritol kinase [Desulfitobacteriaceae bacterium]
METLHEIFAYAKINLGLAIVGRRSDGYHELQSVMQSIELHDIIRVERLGNSLVCQCGELSGPGNLAYKAAALFLRNIEVNEGVLIKIDKQIPLQAGLAGGSSDAAAVLLLLNEIYQKPLNFEELKRIALMCGSDVCFFLTGGTMWATGRGEELEALPAAPKMELVLVKPLDGIDTSKAYRRFDVLGRSGRINKEDWQIVLRKGQIKEIAALLHNDFELVSAEMVPEIYHVKQELLRTGCYGSLMSGSGSTVFGIARDKEHAAWAEQKMLKKGFSQVWCASTQNG